MLQLPLAAKLAGASALVAIVGVGAVRVLLPLEGARLPTAVLLCSGLGGALVINLMLVRLALRPLRDLGRAAQQVQEGDYAARVPRSRLADAEIASVGRVVNTLLDELIGDRERMRTLASEIIRDGDLERATMAHELQESVAQALVAVTCQLATIARNATLPALAEQLDGARAEVLRVLDEVSHIAHTAHPRVLEDLGLIAALHHLARTASDGADTVIAVDVRGAAEALLAIPPDSEMAIYRTVQEAVGNALRHADASRIDVTVDISEDAVAVRVGDNGVGINPASTSTIPRGASIFTMRQRIALAGGELSVHGAPGLGTSVQATVPLDRTDDPVKPAHGLAMRGMTP